MNNLRGAKPIPNPNIKQDIISWNKLSSIYDDSILQKFKDKFVSWIASSKYNKLEGLEGYKDISYVHGTIQSFDHFYLIQKKKRFRFFKGEFFYHKCSFQHDWNWAYIEDDEIKRGDAVILSVPFSDYGKQHPLLTQDFLNYCDENSIPVMLDFAYYPMAKNINVNLNHNCIQLITFSLSKAFYGMEHLRVGIRMVNDFRHVDDGIGAFNEQQMVNRVGAAIGYELMSKYSVDYNWDTFREKYSQVCKQMNLEETDCVMFGIGGNEYNSLNRGSDKNRVCISDLLI